MKSLVWISMGLCVGAMGCAPTMQQLVDHKHYREALCLSVDEGEADEVATALVEDANLHVHVHHVTPVELERVVGEETQRRIGRRAQFVRVILQSNALPLDGYDLQVGFESSGPVAASAAPVSWQSLAYATTEQLPPRVTHSTYATVGNILIGAAAVFSAGTSLLFTGGFREGQVSVEAPRSDFVKYAPDATRLHDQMNRDLTCRTLGSSSHQQKNCEIFFVLDAKPNARWALRVEQRFASQRLTLPSYEADQRCTASATQIVELGTIAENAQRVFGERMQPINAMAQPPEINLPPATTER